MAVPLCTLYVASITIYVRLLWLLLLHRTSAHTPMFEPKQLRDEQNIRRAEEEKINVPEQKSINVRDFLSFSPLQRDPLLFLNFSCGYQDRKVSFSLGREEHTAAVGSLFVWGYVRAGGGEIGVERSEVLHSS